MRTCQVCGKKVTEGMTDGYYYWHEGKCFTSWMDKTYGKHKWMALGGDAEDGYGGYYIHAEEVEGGYDGTGIYYTEWEDDDI